MRTYYMEKALENQGLFNENKSITRQVTSRLKPGGNWNMNYIVVLLLYSLQIHKETMPRKAGENSDASMNIKHRVHILSI